MRLSQYLTLQKYINLETKPKFEERGNRYKGDSGAPSLPTYRGGLVLSRDCAKPLTNFKFITVIIVFKLIFLIIEGRGQPTPSRLMLRAKGVRDKDGKRVLITEYDNKLK